MLTENENVYWATIRQLDKRVDYLEISQTSDMRWAVKVDGHDYSVRTGSKNFWDILHAALELRKRRLDSLSE